MDRWMEGGREGGKEGGRGGRAAAREVVKLLPGRPLSMTKEAAMRPPH